MTKHFDLLEYIKQYQQTFGFPPTQSEMAAAFSVTRPTIHDKLAMLITSGKVERTAGKIRTYRVVENN